MKYFKPSEFDSPDEAGSGAKMSVPFLHKLESARVFANIPFKITSGYRTESWNEKVGGVTNSSHTKGLAVDIAVKSDKDRFLILKALIQSGFTRIGIGSNFIHVDDDNDKNFGAWVYG
jgi:uncharacterized protein YcbK (DUF882 family)